MNPKPNLERNTQTAPENLPPITLEQQEMIRRVENFSTSPHRKFSLILLILGKRKVSLLSSWGSFNTEEEAIKFKEETQKDMGKLVEFCKSMGFETDIETDIKHGEHSFTGGMGVLVAQNRAYLKQMAEAEKSGNDETIGLLFGYPATAAAWFGRSSQDEKTYDRSPEVKAAEEQENLGIFVNFIPSPDHWREELAEVKKTKELVQKYAPALYRELLQEARE
jgi:hypothetical protein